MLRHRARIASLLAVALLPDALQSSLPEAAAGCLQRAVQRARRVCKRLRHAAPAAEAAKHAQQKDALGPRENLITRPRAEHGHGAAKARRRDGSQLGHESRGHEALRARGRLPAFCRDSRHRGREQTRDRRPLWWWSLSHCPRHQEPAGAMRKSRSFRSPDIQTLHQPEGSERLLPVLRGADVLSVDSMALRPPLRTPQ